jgi:hypothetical protein
MTISVMLMLVGLLGLLGFFWCQSDISSAVRTLWFVVCDFIYSGLLTMVIKVSLALLA